MQYLDKTTLEKNIIYGDIKVDDLISADSYNEEEIMKHYNSIDQDGQNLLLKCAIHMAVIGFGNKTFGMIRDKNDQPIEIRVIFNKYKIIHNQNINEKYDKSTLSARRLIRLLRYHIQRFIMEAQRPSYLWLKYSDRNPSTVAICFPGAEHLVETSDEAIYLLNTYKNLDLQLNTKFLKRLERIFIARKILMPEYFTSNLVSPLLGTVLNTNVNAPPIQSTIPNINRNNPPLNIR
jgi:hypothetical protein